MEYDFIVVSVRLDLIKCPFSQVLEKAINFFSVSSHFNVNFFVVYFYTAKYFKEEKIIREICHHLRFLLALPTTITEEEEIVGHR